MGKTKIEWVKLDDAQGMTWNPTRGCCHASPGCANCYAEQISARFSGEGQPFHLFAERDPRPHFTGKVELIESMLDVPLRRKKPTMWFVNSMSDLFHESLPDEAIDRVFAVMALCPQHVFQVLTKRAERMRDCAIRIGRSITFLEKPARGTGYSLQFVGMDGKSYGLTPWPLPNCWLGVSVENQEYADERIPLLLQTPAAVRFISAEPLLGSVDLTCIREQIAAHSFRTFSALEGVDSLNKGTSRNRLDWVIVGGESGSNARPFDLAWARSIIAQCRAAGVRVFMKQVGSFACEQHESGTAKGGCHRPLTLRDLKGGDPAEWPEDVRVRQMPEHGAKRGAI
jgi:protein gp37